MVTPGGAFTEHRLPLVLWPARLGGVHRASLMTGRLESCPLAHPLLPELPEDMGLQIVSAVGGPLGGHRVCSRAFELRVPPCLGPQVSHFTPSSLSMEKTSPSVKRRYLRQAIVILSSKNVQSPNFPQTLPSHVKEVTSSLECFPPPPGSPPTDSPDCPSWKALRTTNPASCPSLLG